MPPRHHKEPHHDDPGHMKPHEVSEHVESIEERNRRVEADKAWETSWTRRVVIAGGTYVIVAGYLSFINVDGALLHAAVPAGAYLISTQTMPFFKKAWVARIYRQQDLSNNQD